jgi:hypothetical protein
MIGCSKVMVVVDYGDIAKGFGAVCREEIQRWAEDGNDNVDPEVGVFFTVKIHQLGVIPFAGKPD